ncbi:8-oxoguanine glycosylase ogg1 [Balamuthia mandrillaris]
MAEKRRKQREGPTASIPHKRKKEEREHQHGEIEEEATDVGGESPSKRQNTTKLEKGVKQEETLERKEGSLLLKEDGFRWRQLKLCAPNELRLGLTLQSGQSFRWRSHQLSPFSPSSSSSSSASSSSSSRGGDGEAVVWSGVIGRVVFFLHQHDESTIHYRFLCSDAASSPSSSEVKEEEEAAMEAQAEAALRDYFQLDTTSMQQAWLQWTTLHAPASNAKDNKKKSESVALLSHFRDIGPRFYGLRLLRQDPLECLVSFICSQNNNIGRIMKMVEALCKEYGDCLIAGDHKANSTGMPFHAFPTLQQLCDVSESRLRELGFGYRARYIPAAAKQILANNSSEGKDWLASLRSNEVTREEAQKSLTSLMGIGRKVADCIALCSLDKQDAIPVDTHVWQIAQRFMRKLQGKGKGSLNETMYRRVGDFFRTTFRENTGWAHTLLFAAELSVFQQQKTKTKSGSSTMIAGKTRKTLQAKQEEGEEEEEEEETEQTTQVENSFEVNTSVRRSSRIRRRSLTKTTYITGRIRCYNKDGKERQSKKQVKAKRAGKGGRCNGKASPATPSSFLMPTFVTRLADPSVQTVMLCGCGGGFDFVHSMILYPELKRLGKKVVIASYSFGDTDEIKGEAPVVFEEQLPDEPKRTPTLNLHILQILHKCTTRGQCIRGGRTQCCQTLSVQLFFSLRVHNDVLAS